MSVGMLEHFTDWDDKWQGQSFFTAGNTFKNWFKFNEFKMETFLSLGVVSFGLAIILGITSLPSVTDVLTWKEFAFVQSKLGWLCLCFGTAHDLFMGFRYIFIEPPILCGFFFTATTVSSKFQTLSTVTLPFQSEFFSLFFLIKKVGK